MTATWGAWEVDEVREAIVKPRLIKVGPILARLAAKLVLAEGRPVSRRDLADCMEGVSLASDPYKMLPVYIHMLRKKVRGCVIVERGFGFRITQPPGLVYARTPHALPPEGKHGGPVLRPIDPPAPSAADERRCRLEALLVDQFEATGPHARMAARMIETIFEGEGACKTR